MKVNTDATIVTLENRFSFSFVARVSTCMLKEAQAMCNIGDVQSELAEAIIVHEVLGWIKVMGGTRFYWNCVVVM